MRHPLDESFEKILYPNSFVKNFACMDEFKEWCLEGSVKDIQEAIKVFEEHELYSYCANAKSNCATSIIWTKEKSLITLRID